MENTFSNPETGPRVTRNFSARNSTNAALAASAVVKKARIFFVSIRDSDHAAAHRKHIQVFTTTGLPNFTVALSLMTKTSSTLLTWEYPPIPS